MPDIRPIREEDLDAVAGKCWEGRDSQRRLLATQEILGMGVWVEGKCVGQLHCYKVALPEWDDSEFPAYGREKPLGWPLGWPLLAAKAKGVEVDGPVWGHACFHVGYTVGASHADPKYFGLGYGAAMCEASVQWARDHGYAAVLAHGGPKVVPAYNTWMGCLPWTTYAHMGFEYVAIEAEGRDLPWWAKQKRADPVALEQVRTILAASADPRDCCARTMLLRF